MTSPVLHLDSNTSKKWSQFLVVCVASVVVFTTGLHTGWPAPSLPKLMSEDYPFEVSSEEASYVTMIGSLGNFFGSFTGYVLLDRIGRRKTLLLISLPQFLFMLFIILSYQMMELLYIGRFIGGIAEGMTGTTIFVYIGEISEPSIRGTLCVLVSIAWYLAVLVINIVGSYLSIRDTALTFIVFPIVFIILFWKMPESPYYALMRNRDDEATQSLKFLRQKTQVSEELISLKADVARQMSETGSFLDILTIESNRKALLATIGARFFQAASGTATFNFYLQILLREATETLDPYTGSTIILAIQVLATMFSPFVVDKLGRKPLLLFSSCGCFLNLAIQTVFFILKEHTRIDVSMIDSLPLVMLVVHIIVYILGFGVVVSVLASEMFSASIKSKSAFLVNGSYALFTFSSIKFYQATADGFGLTVPFASFAVLSFMGVLFFYYIVPETKSKSLEEIQQGFKGRKEHPKIVKKCDPK